LFATRFKDTHLTAADTEMQMLNPLPRAGTCAGK
jgi:hypothetical protein